LVDHLLVDNLNGPCKGRCRVYHCADISYIYWKVVLLFRKVLIYQRV